MRASARSLRELLEGVAERVVLDTSSEGECSQAIEMLEDRGFRATALSMAGERTYSKVNATRLIWWERSEK